MVQILSPKKGEGGRGKARKVVRAKEMAVSERPGSSQ
jgi:hypothetical protein